MYKSGNSQPIARHHTFKKILKEYFMGQYKMISILIKMSSIFKVNLPVDIDHYKYKH